MKITSAYIIVGRGNDQVFLTIDLEPSIGSDTYSAETMRIRFEASYNKGLEYVFKHFPGISVEIIDFSTHTKTFYDVSGAKTKEDL